LFQELLDVPADIATKHKAITANVPVRAIMGCRPGVLQHLGDKCPGVRH